VKPEVYKCQGLFSVYKTLFLSLHKTSCWFCWFFF